MIVQRIVREHGGRIELESNTGQGTTFRLWFPLTEQQPLRLTGGENPSAGKLTIMLKPTVLIVDDEKPTVKAYGRHLRIATMSTLPRTVRVPCGYWRRMVTTCYHRPTHAGHWRARPDQARQIA